MLATSCSRVFTCTWTAEPRACLSCQSGGATRRGITVPRISGLHRDHWSKDRDFEIVSASPPGVIGPWCSDILVLWALYSSSLFDLLKFETRLWAFSSSFDFLYFSDLLEYVLRSDLSWLLWALWILSRFCHQLQADAHELSCWPGWRGTQGSSCRRSRAHLITYTPKLFLSLEFHPCSGPRYKLQQARRAACLIWSGPSALLVSPFWTLSFSMLPSKGWTTLSVTLRLTGAKLGAAPLPPLVSPTYGNLYPGRTVISVFLFDSSLR